MVDEFPNPLSVQLLGKGERKQLAQAAGAAAATSIYSPATGIFTEIHSIFVCNISAAGVTFNLYHDDDGTTYTNATKLFGTTNVAANTTTIIELVQPIYMFNPSGNLAADVSSVNDITFTVYGEEFSRSR